MKRDRYTFLPYAVALWGGIDKWQSGDKSAMRFSGLRYAAYSTALGGCVSLWVRDRLARDGRCSVADANTLIAKVCNRYSGTPERTYDAYSIEGIGRLVRDKRGGTSASQSPLLLREKHEEAFSEAIKCLRPLSFVGSEFYADKRHEFPAGAWEVADKRGEFSPLQYCRFCGKRATRQFYIWRDDMKLTGLAPVLGETAHVWACVPCHLRFGKILKAANAADNARVGINATKRKIRESSKVNARTDGSPVLHHGGGDQRGCEGV